MWIDKDLRVRYFDGPGLRPYNFSKKDAYYTKQDSKAPLNEVMTGQGACWFMSKDRFNELEGMDNGHGGWGQMGCEVACKSWLSGGRQMVSTETWFSHLFRTSKDYSFPYPVSGKDHEFARNYSRDLWLNNKWHKQVHDFDWLIEKFSPVPGWESKTVIVPKVETVKQAPKQVKNPTVSVLIPARNEKFLDRTVCNLLDTLVSNYEILVGIDGLDSLHQDLPEAKKHPKYFRVRKLISAERIGMRPMINKLAADATGNYLLRADAHCIFDKGMDARLLLTHDTLSKDNPIMTVSALRYELDGKTWTRRNKTDCPYRYLSHPEDPKGGLRGLAWPEYEETHRHNVIDKIMTLSGSNWLMTKEQWDHWGGMDENHGTFGQEGCEIACMTWLSGGAMYVDKGTWYAHWNRGKAPYAMGSGQKKKSIAYSQEKWLSDSWPYAVRPFQYLIDMFNPPEWIPSYSPLPAKRQGTHKKGFIKTASELWAFRYAITEQKKQYHVISFWDAFLSHLGGSSSDYATYLRHLYIKSGQYLKNPNNFERRVGRLLDSATELYQSIKSNGLMSPLEFYIEDGNLVLSKGYRRLCCIYAINPQQEIPCRVYKSKELAKAAYREEIPAGKIQDLGIDQFITLKGESTDKYWVHDYLRLYDRHIGHLHPKKVLELGAFRGASLLLWEQAFPKAKIYGYDKNVTKWKSFVEGHDRIKMIIGNEKDADCIKNDLLPKGPFDIIIDDADHNPDVQWDMLQKLWPSLTPGGCYVIEDCHYSFNPKRFNNEHNTVQNVANRVDQIYSMVPAISSLHFYYNICFISKS